MQERQSVEEPTGISNRARLEVLEDHTNKITSILDGVTNNLAELRVAMETSNKDNQRAMENIRRETNTTLERLERRLAENRPRTPPHGGDAYADGLEASVTESMHASPRQGWRHGGRVENCQGYHERWIPNAAFEREDPLAGYRARSPSVHHEHQEFEHEQGYEEPYQHEQPGPWRRQHGRGYHGPQFERDDYEDRRGNRHQDWGPRRPKVDFPKYSGGDPYEWLDKVHHYFLTYDIPRHERVSIACFYLEGKAGKWWRWIRDQYDKDHMRLGWTAFEKELLSQFGPSPVVNHHGQLAKLRQEGKVQHYIEEFRQLQIMVRGWSEEALIGTFIDGLRPWLAKEIKLRQPTRLPEVMKMAEILEESHSSERRPTKDMGSKSFKTVQTKVSWKGRDTSATTSKPRPEIKKLSSEEVQERIKKGLCFKCGDKWSPGHKCKAAQALFMFEDESSDDESESSQEEPSQEEETEETESGGTPEEAELSLNAMAGISKPTSMRLMAWVGKHEVILLVDSGSTHNFINSSIVGKVGLKPSPIPPFEVKVASGEKLQCEALIREVKMNVQGVRIMADLHVLPLVGLDLVLGNAWLKSLGRVVHDYHNMTMEFKLGSKKRLWTAIASKEIKSCEAIMFEKLCKGGAHCFAIVVAKEDVMRQVENKGQEGTHDDLALLPEEVKPVLAAHKGVLEVPTALPPPREFDHRIRLVDETKPINVPPYRYAHFQKGEIERQVDEMLKSGLIRPSTSPFSSPVLLVRKKDGTWRFCTDYRALNEATVKDRFPIPTVDEMLDELHGATVFSKLDLRAGYHQIRMNEEDIHKTAFRTHSGHYEYLVMPFGLCNAPSTFQAAMNSIFKPLLRKFVLVFFDDILVYSRTIEEHKQHLEKVLTILEEHHFFIKATKCAFMEKELEYLGHFISGDGVKVDHRKIEAMVDWPLPKDISALRGFLGLTGYYRRFVKGYGLIAKPLTAMLKKDSFEWTTEAREAFEELKRAMTKTPVLALPNFERSFEVYTDASGEGIGAVLVQDRRPLAFISKALGPMKKAWSTYARELLAVVHAVKVWRPYLLGRNFTIITDQQALRHLLQQKIVTPEQQKFLVKLLGFEYDIVYQPGKENKVADALSRREGSQLLKVVGDDEESSNLALSGAEWRVWDKIREATRLDARALEIIELLDAQGQGVVNYKVRDGLIFYKNYVYVPNVPNLRDEILNHFHNSKEGGHSGWLRTYIRLKHFFHWEGIKGDVKRLVASCDICQKAKYDTRPEAGLLQPLPIPNRIWEDLAMDFIEGLPISAGHEVILVVVDRLSKYAHFIPLYHPYTAKSVAKAFVNNITKLHGFPRTIVSDRDRVFMSSFWRQLFELQGSKLKTSSSYHPQTDGQSEVVNRTLEQYLRCFCHEEQRRWADYLPWAEFWYNTSYHSSIEKSPFEVVYGRPPPLLVSYEKGSASNNEVEQELIDRDEVLAKVKRELKKAQTRMKKYHDQGRRAVSFKVGDYVYLKLRQFGQKTMRKTASAKLNQKFYGPYRVLEKLGSVAYKLQLPPTSQLHPVFHVSLLKKKVGDPSLIGEELPTVDQEGRILMKPKEVLGYRLHRRGRGRPRVWQALILWEGLSRDEATWEDYDGLEKKYPQLILEGKDMLKGRGNVKTPRQEATGHALTSTSPCQDSTPAALLASLDCPQTVPLVNARPRSPSIRQQTVGARTQASHELPLKGIWSAPGHPGRIWGKVRDKLTVTTHQPSHSPSPCHLSSHNRSLQSRGVTNHPLNRSAITHSANPLKPPLATCASSSEDTCVRLGQPPKQVTPVLDLVSHYQETPGA
ncbi:uncharacterized protein LOC122301779 [Carya illinoinensis]|uniref:uncharacterized protein LOC122301779 n=1 Tax=Carya illinoinensis TaxID=32201 RepID=UPI001C718450|nr:uncharacterized protein LOC122301779 [Carya illinoinensis]